MLFNSVRNFLLSAWAFFFRWPKIKITSFYSSAILLGPLYQAAVFTIFFFLFRTANFGPPELQMLSASFSLSALTGFFHEDGFADTADSLGVSKFDSSLAVLEKIQTAFKDPRLGTFGVSALIALWFFRYSITFLLHFSIFQIIFCYLISRTIALSFGVLCSRYSELGNNPRSSHLMAQIKTSTALLVFLLTAILAISILIGGSFLGHFPASNQVWISTALRYALVSAACAAGSALLGNWLVKRSETLNGDILGALACSSEMLCAVLLTKFS